jgi:arabinogalactan oligomer/maltooligosaccharide transport system substrate-binding protein
MKKYRVLSLVLAVLMIASVVSACDKPTDTKQTTAPADNKTTSPTPVTLTVWESDGPEKLFIEEMAKAYMVENQHVTIVAEPVSHTDTAQRLQLDGPAGVGADVFAAPHDKLGEMLVSGIILENTYTDIMKNTMVEAATNATSSEGKLYGYPTGIETYALFYNKALVSSPPETWDEVKEFAKIFNGPKEGKYAIVWDVDDGYFNYMFLSGYGADLFGPDGTDKSKHMVNSPEAIKSLEYFQGFRKDYLDVAAADLTGDFMSAGFQEGKIAMAVTGPWAINGYREAGVDFGVATLPRLPGQSNPPASFSGIRAMYVSAFSNNPEEAHKFAAYLTTNEALLERYEITKQIPPHKDIKIEDDAHAGILAQFEFSKPMPSIPAMNNYWPAVGSAYANIWNGSDIKAELELAAEAIEAAP